MAVLVFVLWCVFFPNRKSRHISLYMVSQYTKYSAGEPADLFKILALSDKHLMVSIFHW